MLKEKSIAINRKKGKVIGICVYILFLIVVGINFYTKLINEETCGPKSKILFTALFTLVSVAAAIIIFYLNKKDRIKPEKVFLIIGVTFGIMYMFATPLFKGHDEQYHWYKSYAVSLGKFKAVQNEEKILGDYLPKMVNDVFEIQGFFTGINYKTAASAWKYSIDNNYKSEEVFTYNAPTAIYPPIQMIPQAIGIIISRAICLDIYTQGMFARLGNLCFFLCLGYFSIKNIPRKKYFLSLFLLSPKIMYISSTMSGDVFTNSMIIFFITYILKLKHEKKLLNWKNYLVLFISIPCVAICKTIYIPICLLVLMLPRECFNKKSKKVLFVVLAISIALSTSLLWTKLSNNISLDTTSDTNASKQLKYVLENPVSYIGVLIRGVCNNFIVWAEDIVGGYMEWGSGLTQPEIVSMIVFIILILSLANEGDTEKEKLKIWEYILIIIMILIVVAGVLSAMYIQWTPNYAKVGGLDIIGVQGRYFVPIIPLIAMLIPMKFLETKNKLDIKWLYIIIILCEVFSLLNIFVRNI